MPRIYICGPIRNMQDGNKVAFAKAAQEWRNQGWEVISPWELELQKGWAQDNLAHRMHCLRDIAALALCDAIVFLPGWDKSIGAVAELSCAHWMKIPDFNAEDPFHPSLLKYRDDERSAGYLK